MAMAPEIPWYGYAGHGVFDSKIINVDADFFSKSGDLKRYLVGTERAQGLQTLQVAILSEQAATSVASTPGYHIMEDFELDFHNDAIMLDASRIANITGSLAARDMYGATGNGTIIAVADSGVDFSNPDIQHSLARDPHTNHPIMLDPDGQGIIITNATFYAHIDEDHIIHNYSKSIPPNMTSSVYVSKDGVFLDVVQRGNGTTIQIYNSFYPAAGFAPIFNGSITKDMKIGQNNRDYIKSRSGVYHLGMMYQGALQGPAVGVQVVPVLVVDSNVPGVYDTIIPDLSTSWADYTKAPKEKFDFDFTDELPIVLGSGKEFLVYDSDGDGTNDYSAGTLGARVLDVYEVMHNTNGTNSTDATIHDLPNILNATLLPALDPEGMFFGAMTDFDGHGTASAASIVSRGEQTYHIYNDSQKYSIYGTAPDAKIIPVKMLWFGDTAYGWLWSAGFDNYTPDAGVQENDPGDEPILWNYSGQTRADIISNSWGISTFPVSGMAPGLDVLSILSSMLATPMSIHDDYPGVIMVNSAGNSGHGYGTLGMPAASPFVITVGATTNNVFVGYGPFQGQPRFGNTTIHHSHMVDFSSRGPSVVGDPKPDLLGIGAYGFTPSSVLRTDTEAEPFALFGGTSMSAPLVSGAAAVLVQSMRDAGMQHDPFVVKNILMSTATDLHSDPFTQGAGMVNIKAALDFVHGNGNAFVVYNDGSYTNIRKVLEPAMRGNVNNTGADAIGGFGLPHHPFEMESWFAGRLLPGERSTVTFTVENPTDRPMHVRVSPETITMMSQSIFNGTTEVRVQDPTTNKNDTYAPNYVRLSDVRSHQSLSEYFEYDDVIPDDSTMMVLGVNFSFEQFMNQTTAEYAEDIGIASLYLYDWVDHNNDTDITSDELSMVSRAGSWGTVQEMRVSDPASVFEGVPMVGVYPVPTRYSYWTGDTGQNSTSMQHYITASHYKREPWQVVWPESESLLVPAQDKASMSITLVVPDDAQTGVYQGFVVFEGDHTVNVPVSYVVAHPVHSADYAVTIQGVQGDMMYGNGYTKGAFDMINRYMSGDWRQYYFEIRDESVRSVGIEVSWDSVDTNIGVFVVDPSGGIVQTNVPSGVFGQFMGWVSLDWLGSTAFSQGGGFYPVKNKNDTSTLLYVPINQTGTYAVLTHTTLFGGNSTTEPMTLEARFAGDDLIQLQARSNVGMGDGMGDDSMGDGMGDDGMEGLMELESDDGMVEVTRDGVMAGDDTDGAMVQTTILDEGREVVRGDDAFEDDVVGSSNMVVDQKVPADDTMIGESLFGIGITLGAVAGVAAGVVLMLVVGRRRKGDGDDDDKKQAEHTEVVRYPFQPSWE